MAYQTILHIAMSHTYTTASAKALYSLELTPATRSWLEGMPLLWRPLNHGYALLADVDHPGYSLFQERYNKHTLYLEWLPAVDWLINATDLPMGQKAAPYAFAGKEGNVAPFGESPYFNWLRGGLSWSQESPINNWELRDISDSISLIGEAGGKSRLDIDMREVSEGFYSLWLDGAFASRFYYGGLSKRPFGVLGLPLDRLPAKGEPAITYEWKLEARSTYRKYFLISRGRELDNMSLNAELVGEKADQHLPEALNFTAPENTLLPDGKEAMLSTGSEPLRLQDNYAYVVRLRATGLREPLTLPHARPENIFPDRASEKVYSEIYVYL